VLPPSAVALPVSIFSICWPGCVADRASDTDRAGYGAPGGVQVAARLLALVGRVGPSVESGVHFRIKELHICRSRATKFSHRASGSFNSDAGRSQGARQTPLGRMLVTAFRRRWADRRPQDFYLRRHYCRPSSYPSLV
jgi:hypothetical protein